MTSISDPNRAPKKSDVGPPSYALSIARQAMPASLRGGQKPVDRAVNLIQEIWQRGRIADIILGEIGANDLAADKIKTEVQLAPESPFSLSFMLLLAPITLAENLQTGTTYDQLHSHATLGFRLSAQHQTIAPPRKGRKIRHCDLNPQQLRDAVHKALGLAKRLLENHA